MQLPAAFSHNRVRVILLGLTLVFSLAPASVLVFNIVERYLPASQQADSLAQAADMAGHIARAAAHHALERGGTLTLISELRAGGDPDPELLAVVRREREAGEGNWAEVMTHAEALVAQEWGGRRLAQVLADAKAAHAQAQALRVQVDQALAGERLQVRGADWLKAMTRMIELGAELRRTAFMSSQHFQVAVMDDAEVARALWLMSEYAGRERALLGAAIASGRPVSAEVLAQLNAYRGVVEVQAQFIEQLMARLGTDDKRQLASGVGAAYAAMRAEFLGEFQGVREGVYADAATGEYRLSAREWVQRSSAAIDSILEFSAAMTRGTEAYAHAAGEENRLYLWLGGALILIAAGGGVVSMLIVLWLIRRIRRVQHGIVGAEDGNDLSARIADGADDEIGALVGAFNGMLEKFSQTVRESVRAAGDLTGASRGVATASQRSLETLRRQQEEVEQVATAMNQMSASIAEVARHAQSAADAAREAAGEARHGQQLVGDSLEGFNLAAAQVERAAGVVRRLHEESKEIGMVIEVINGVAEQTNLLALNAAIEAARAGEQGRGFAVVADEVRVLAGRTHDSTQQIQDIIERLQGGIGESVEVMETTRKLVETRREQAAQAGEALATIARGVDSINDMNAQIASAVEEQSATAEEINRGTISIRDMAEAASGQAQQMSQASKQLAELAETLDKLVRRFKTG